MKILMATWGNPLGWQEVGYYYKGKSEKSKDPLGLIKEVENPDKTIIVIPDTLSDNSIDSLKNPSYSEIKTICDNLIFNFCTKELNFTPNKIIISYGFGEFNRTKFQGNAMDFYYKVFQELSFYFAELLAEMESKEIEVIFDATHGINYTTILTYRSLREILEIFSYVYDVKLKVLNSDPFFGRAGVSKLNINIIEESKILPRISVYNSSKKPIEPYVSLEGKDKKELGQIISNFLSQISYNRDEILVFLGSFFFALPVFVLSYMISPKDLKDKIEKISNEFENFIFLNSSGKLEILRKFEFKENFSNLVKAFLISAILEKLGFKKLSDFQLSEVEKLKEEIFKNLPVESNRIDKEIYDIQNLQNITQDYQVYSSILNKNLSKIDKRNLFAHAGFEHNTIELRKDNNEIYIRTYENDKKEVENLIINSLPKI
jgi:CRISPR-associated protein, MJ1666 family